MTKALPLIVSALLLPSGAALAQTISVTLNNSSTPATTGSSFPFHLAACQQALAGSINSYNEFQLEWAVATGVTYQAFWTSNPSCTSQSASDGGNSNLPISVSATQNTVTIDGEAILNQITGQADPCDNPAPPSAAVGTVYICITGTEPDQYATGGSLTLTPFDIAFQYDMNPPAAPSGVSVTPSDSELNCSWSFPYQAPPVTTVDTGVVSDTGDNADHFVVYAQQDSSLTPTSLGACSPSGGADAGILGTVVDPTGWQLQVNVPTPSSSSSGAAVSGLTNGLCYDVSVIAFYPDGTQGTASPVQAAAPIEIFDYWRMYHSAGGTDDGGLHCQSAGGGLVPLALAAVGLLALRRRRRAR